jgi:hypothetical protein
MSRTWKDTKKFKEEWNKIYSFSSTWPGSGKYWKRQLHKARRQLDKEIIAYQLGEVDKVRDHSYANIAGEVNWRTW